MIFSSVLVLSLVKIVPIDVSRAKMEINNWVYEAYEKSDIRRVDMFTKSLQNYDFNTSEDIHCISLQNNTNTVNAIILFEKIKKNIYLWDISVRDNVSGSMLIKAVTKVSSSKIVIMNTVDDRWKVAKAYHSKSFGE